MNILWIATKEPWPPVDGGRLLMALTLEALAELGHRVTVVAPRRLGDPPADERLVDDLPDGVVLRPVASSFRAKLLDLAAAWPRACPFSIQRHSCRPCREAAADLWQGGAFDVVHVEQVQALANVPDAVWRDGAPVVLRAQNVESDLWFRLAPHRGLGAPALRLEGRFLARYEGRAVRRCAVAALTDEDRDRLASLGGSALTAPRRIFPPFPAEQPAGRMKLDGAPPLVVLGSTGWLPNRQGADWFLRSIWPDLWRRQPQARLHLFGDHSAGVLPDGTGVLPDGTGVLPDGTVVHAPPERSEDVFVPGAVLVVPLHIASGIRMKILEAWSRGVPVIATSTAARGLGAVHGEHLFIADDVDDFDVALDRLRRPEVYGEMVAAGRRRLVAEHEPRRIAGLLAELYASARVTAKGAGAAS